MLTTLIDLPAEVMKWSNDNQGVVSVAIFAITIAYGWASGIFSALRRKPKFKLSLIEGPTFCCTYPLGNTRDEYETHSTAIALYLVVANVGSAASSIEDVSVGYHAHFHRFSIPWIRYTIGWLWLKYQSTALADFQAKIGENTKVYPFLFQKSFLLTGKPETFLEPGQSTSGVVYFEQPESWGGFFPSVRASGVRIKIRVSDVFGSQHTEKFTVRAVSLEEARKYNPAFGKTLSEIHGKSLPFDKSI